MASFTGTLNSNEIFSALYNMIISQQVFADNIAGTNASLVDISRVDGSLYGDTKLYYSSDCLASSAWGNDAEAANLLAIHRPSAPDCQRITLNKFRQICLTTDNYLSKRAWGTEGAFSEFNSVMKGWINDTKRVYDSTTFNSYVGTATTSTGSQTQTLTVTDGDNLGQLVAEKIANIFVEMQDVSRDYNDYGHLRSYDYGDLIVVWNSNYLNKIKKLDMPTLFHNEGLIDKFGEYTLPAKYFGTVNTTAGTTGTSNTTIRALVEKTYGTKHCFAGELLPASTAYLANETYTTDSKVICKIMNRKSVPFMSAFEASTSFFNPKSLTETNYLTWGHNTLEYLKNYPFVTLKQA